MVAYTSFELKQSFRPSDLTEYLPSNQERSDPPTASDHWQRRQRGMSTTSATAEARKSDENDSIPFVETTTRQPRPTPSPRRHLRVEQEPLGITLDISHSNSQYRTRQSRASLMVGENDRPFLDPHLSSPLAVMTLVSIEGGDRKSVV